MKECMNKDEFVKYLRKRQMSFSEFYSLLNTYFNLTTDERMALVKTTPMYKKLKEI